MIVGVTGYAQHGKDTLAAELVAAHGYTRIGFADQLKALALAIDPVVTCEECAGAEAYAHLGYIVDSEGWEEAKKYREVRRFLQELGTQAREFLGPDVWVQALEKAWLESAVDKLVVPDVRFPNEAQWVKKHGGILVRVSRTNPDGTPFDNGVGTDHPSEALISELPVDFAWEFQTGDLISIREVADALGTGDPFSKARDLSRGPKATTSEELQELFS